jgi:hypothetical protein
MSAMTEEAVAYHITPSLMPQTFINIVDGPLMYWGGVGGGKTTIIKTKLPPMLEELITIVSKERKHAWLTDAYKEALEDFPRPHGTTAPGIWEFRINDHDLLDYAGMPKAKGDMQTHLVPQVWPGAVEWHTEQRRVFGVLFLDEYAQAGKEKQTAVQRLMDEGRMGNYILPGHPVSDPECERGLVFLILAGNRKSDKANSHGMGNQTGTRLTHYVVDPCLTDTVNYGNENNWAPEVLAWIVQDPSWFYKGIPNKSESELPTGVTPRTLENLSKKVLRVQPPEIEFASYAGCVGEGAATSFLAVLHAGRHIDVESALRDPANAPIPQETGNQFAAAALLIRRANRENFANIVQYLERVGENEFASPEIAVFVVEAIARRQPTRKESVTYRDFAMRWADIRS